MKREVKCDIAHHDPPPLQKSSSFKDRKRRLSIREVCAVARSGWSKIALKSAAKNPAEDLIAHRLSELHV